MEYDVKNPQYSTADKNSFAWVTARERWPIILTKAIEDVHRSIAECAVDSPKYTEGKGIIREIGALKYEIQHDRVLVPIRDDGEPDVAQYNSELDQRGYPSWLDVPWLYAECYLFRRLSTSFSLSTHWKHYDPFARQKIDTFRSSRPAVLELAARYRELIEEAEKRKSNHTVAADKSNDDVTFATERTLFEEMCEICLWGNATDLSLLTNLSYEDIQKLQGAAARRKAEANILVNELPQVYSVLVEARNTKPKTAERRVDIVLDNAGFELYVDLILAGYLLHSGLATVVVLHPKNIPWFVSDVIPQDFAALLNALANPKSFYETLSNDDARMDRPKPTALTDTELDNLSFLFAEWSKLYANGQIVLRPNNFWTQAGSYWRLPNEAPELLDDLRSSEVVIFKGDLNYRKLTGDAAWNASTPFVEAIGPLGPGSGINVLALRTCKADVVVGLPPGRDEELKHKDDGGGNSGARKWAWSGKWAVVSFSKGRQP